MDTKCSPQMGRKLVNTKLCVSLIAVLAIIVGCVFLSAKATESSKDPLLRKVFFVFRHGDKAPTESYPNDPYINYTWPGGWGGLTKRGVIQMYGLGEWLGDKYGHLTDYKYDPRETMVNSSYADRCTESAQAFLAGYFKKDGLIEGLPWRPIAVHYVPRDQDKILVVKNPCPRLEEALTEAMKNESARWDAELKSYYEELSSITGREIRSILDVHYLYDVLDIQVHNGLEIPEALRPYYEDKKMWEIAARGYNMFTSNLLARRLRGGPLLKDVLDHMEKENETKKLFVYATHDISIINSLRAMGFTEEYFKLDFGVTLVFELRSIEGSTEQEVKISKIKSADSRTFETLNIPGCGEPCTLDALRKVWKDVLPEDWEKECNMN